MKACPQEQPSFASLTCRTAYSHSSRTGMSKSKAVSANLTSRALLHVTMLLRICLTRSRRELQRLQPWCSAQLTLVDDDSPPLMILFLQGPPVTAAAAVQPCLEALQRPGHAFEYVIAAGHLQACIDYAAVCRPKRMVISRTFQRHM